MPTIDKIDGYRVFYYSNDHAPAHVHVTNSNSEAVFLLNCPGGPATLRDKPHNMASHEANQLGKLVSKAVAKYCKEWSDFYGQ
ncbi:DUF4160 domain-containing protein [Pseudomonas atagonensis]|uniref:DUF4160 domain-containing protein n=1 Tax=Pseudomonas atagonensis TaxID=2609964 RepID=UPI00140D4249